MKMKLFLLLTFFVMLMQSCTKDPFKVECRTPQTYYVPIKSEALKQTPYFTNPAFDTISFASDKGDTLTFVKTKTDTSWYYEQGSGDPDCGYDDVFFQTLHNTYTTIKGNGSFDVKHSKKIYYNGSTSDLVEIKFNILDFLIQDYYIGSRYGGTFYDSLTKGNKTYKNVIDIYHNFNDSIVGIAYINKDYGVFSIKDNQTNTEISYLSK